MPAAFTRARRGLILALRRLFLGALSTYARSTPFSRTAMTVSDIGGFLFMVIADGRLSFPFLGAKRRRRPRSDSNPNEQLPLVALHPSHGTAESIGSQQTEPAQVSQTTEPNITAPPMTPISSSHKRRIYLFTLSLVLYEIAKAIDLNPSVINALSNSASNTSVKGRSVLFNVTKFVNWATRNGKAS